VSSYVEEKLNFVELAFVAERTYTDLKTFGKGFSTEPDYTRTG